jgi:protein-S-isoprenylcysteine O-methyltransferase Ste14
MNTELIYTSLLLLNGCAYYKLQKNNNIDTTNRSEIILILLIKFFGVFIPLFAYYYKFKKYNLNNNTSKYIGIIILLSVFFLLIHNNDTLGNMYSIDIKIKKGHKLITSGIYKYIRHPIYLCSLLFLIGQQTILPNKIGMISSSIAFSLLYFIRIPAEEKMLLNHFGKEYEKYMKNTNKIIPTFTIL